MNCYRQLIKPAADRTAAFLLLLFFLPFLLLLSLMLLLHFRKNPFFVQPRVGQYERIFYLYKFRTMHPCRPGQHPHDEFRADALGRWLRRTGLDELPQLWNILRGDMSFVGPRPLLVEYLPCYKPTERLRHHVKPGITGWAQIHGGKNLPWQEKMHYDLDYVARQSFWLDMQIILRTPLYLWQQCKIIQRV